MENNSIGISIVTPSFNSSSTIEHTLDSVAAAYDALIRHLEKNDPGDTGTGIRYDSVTLEHVIADGGSSDGTINILKQYRDRVPYEVIISSEPDGGIYEGMNKGIKMSSGDLIGIINSDDWFEEDVLINILSAYTGNEHEIIYGAIRIYDGDDPRKPEFYHHDNLLNRMINHPGSFVTAGTYRDYGLFDTTFRSSADYAWMKHASDMGAVFTPVESVLANVRAGGMSSTNVGFRETLKLQYGWGRVSWIRYVLLTFKSHVGDLCRKVFKIKR